MSTQNTAITTLEYRAEAAEQLSDNYAGAIADMVKNSGVRSLVGDRNIPGIEDAIDLYVRLVAAYFLRGDKIQLLWGRLGAKSNLVPLPSAMGGIALAHMRNRICAPRDVSVGATTAVRAAVDKVLNNK